MNATTVKHLCVEVRGPNDRVEYIVPGEVFQFLLSAAVETIRVDQEWYLQTYPDVSEAVKAGAFQDASDHYVRFGYHENRLPRKIMVDEDYYLSKNPDVVEAIGRGAFESGQGHFDRAGYAEGRLPYSGFQLFMDAS
jgi:hypothetical protein